ncbi:hypothetical protein ONJ95_25115 [Salmonella enterica subsp. enterica serovar Virginia]|nr:hypothetical protein [Salmonella enterica subsp. enterica serovar Virginia]
MLMVAIALTNRYVLVPRMRQENPRAVLRCVSAKKLKR